jgi:diguanylate cyclase (GGDEF)-like protein
MAGDKVLRTFGEILRRNTRSDDSAFRYGGEEFAIITQMESLDKIKMFIERILHETRETVVQYDGQQIHFMFSGGIAAMEVNLTRTELIKRADAALYAAKDQGRNRILIFEPVMLVKNSEKSK